MGSRTLSLLARGSSELVFPDLQAQRKSSLWGDSRRKVRQHPSCLLTLCLAGGGSVSFKRKDEVTGGHLGRTRELVTS